MKLASALLAHTGDAAVASTELAAIETAVAAMIAAGRSAWPMLEVDGAAFAGHVGRHAPAERPLSSALPALHADELYLAFACSTGDPRAVPVLEKTYASHLDAVIGGMRGQGLTHEDFRQIIRHRLFVADERGPARIGAYAGHGSLAAWLRVTARRAGLNAVRGQRIDTTATDGQDLLALPQSLGDPELDYLKDSYREEFREAFDQAVAALPARERTLLRQTIVHRLTVRQIGRMYRIHHATAARWVSQARQLLVDATRDALMGRLEVSQRELESIMGLIASRLDLSIARALGPDDDS